MFKHFIVNLPFKKYHPTTRKGPLSLSTNSNRAQPPNIVQVESQLLTEVLETQFDV
jgi:hypothetical protein